MYSYSFDPKPCCLNRADTDAGYTNLARGQAVSGIRINEQLTCTEGNLLNFLDIDTGWQEFDPFRPAISGDVVHAT